MLERVGNVDNGFSPELRGNGRFGSLRGKKRFWGFFGKSSRERWQRFHSCLLLFHKPL